MKKTHECTRKVKRWCVLYLVCDTKHHQSFSLQQIHGQNIISIKYYIEYLFNSLALMTPKRIINYRNIAEFFVHFIAKENLLFAIQKGIFIMRAHQETIV